MIFLLEICINSNDKFILDFLNEIFKFFIFYFLNLTQTMNQKNNIPLFKICINDTAR